MGMKNEERFKETIKELQCESDYDERAVKAYQLLSENKKMTSEQKAQLFEIIRSLSIAGSNRAFVFLGHCYRTGNGCDKSVDNAMECYECVINKKDISDDIRCTAASNMGNLLLDDKKFDEAITYINMSSNPEDYVRMAECNQRNGNERAALEEYKKAGDLGKLEAYRKAVDCCLKSEDTSIRERAVEYAIEYMESDEDKSKKQKMADKISDYYYEELNNEEVLDKRRVEIEFIRFKDNLNRFGLKLKRENKVKKKIKKFNFENNVGSAVTTILATGLVSVISAMVKKKK